VLLETKTGKVRSELQGHNGYLGCLAFSPDGATLAAGDGRTIRLWPVQTGKLRSTFRRHPDTVHTLAFSANGKTLLSADSTQTLLWDVGPPE
jgi:WD40 repeat protein